MPGATYPDRLPDALGGGGCPLERGDGRFDTLRGRHPRSGVGQGRVRRRDVTQYRKGLGDHQPGFDVGGLTHQHSGKGITGCPDVLRDGLCLDQFHGTTLPDSAGQRPVSAPMLWTEQHRPSNVGSTAAGMEWGISAVVCVQRRPISSGRGIKRCDPPAMQIRVKPP